MDEEKLYRALAMQAAIVNSWRPPEHNRCDRAELYLIWIREFAAGGEVAKNLRADFERDAAPLKEKHKREDEEFQSERRAAMEIHSS